MLTILPLTGEAINPCYIDAPRSYDRRVQGIPLTCMGENGNKRRYLQPSDKHLTACSAVLDGRQSSALNRSPLEWETPNIRQPPEEGGQM